MDHRDQTSDHAQRLQQVFEEIGENPRIHKRPDFQGIFQEFKQLKDSTDEPEIMEITALNTAVMAERIETTMYEGLLRLEEDLDIDKEVRKLLEKNKDEEEAALRRLRKMTKDFWFKQLRKNLMS
ncbi:MAG: ferritin-like domain-containing protein [Candidatus Nanohalobium sp.]